MVLEVDFEGGEGGEGGDEDREGAVDASVGMGSSTDVEYCIVWQQSLVMEVWGGMTGKERSGPPEAIQRRERREGAAVTIAAVRCGAQVKLSRWRRLGNWRGGS